MIDAIYDDNNDDDRKCQMNPFVYKKPIQMVDEVRFSYGNEKMFSIKLE